MGWDDLIYPFLGFLMISIKRAHRAKRGIIHLHVHQESLEKGKRMRMEALGEESLGAYIYGGAMTA
jgi:hypothetical protein